ncbi:hypothetical protein [Dyadobacter sp. CY312]|uniref:hypothetical protein n=1 Tax=Dyadobacter sp. CY312 TaxID=2907303 RepID=UPI001F2DF2D6|nr:hypothetical protein [Dyadobacter sp. CY312]MCE7043697.1 hypothetical protein [Dyadobacter sp. CY312]
MTGKSQIFRPIIKNKIVGLFLFLAVFLILSCDSKVEDDQNNEKIFYDLAGFVNQQVSELNKLKPAVTKMTIMGVESNQIETSDINWQKELELFSQADINKPAFRQSYSVSRPDSSTFLYVSKEGDRLPIRRLQIVVDSTNAPLVVEAFIKSDNKLYTSEKSISMRCSNVGNMLMIKSYRVEGFQKLVMMDKKPFLIEAQISY